MCFNPVNFISYLEDLNNELHHGKTYLCPAGNNKDADQTAWICSLISTFVVCCLYSITAILDTYRFLRFLLSLYLSRLV